MNTQPESQGCCSCHAGSKSNANPVLCLNFKQEVLPIFGVIILAGTGLIFQRQLQATPYFIGEYLIFLSAYLLSGWRVLRQAGKNMIKGRIFDENFLMTVATLGAIAIHQLPEAVAVMLFYQIGEFFQNLAVTRSRRSIKSLLEIRPDTAHLKINETFKTVSPEIVKVGDIILVKPGEKIPLDGEIIEGRSQVDTSALTGEAVPRTVNVGETVLAGMMNLTGVLTLEVSQVFSESSISKIFNLVENASSKKAKTEKFITRFAQSYTPIVVCLSLVVALFPPLFLPNTSFKTWIYRALVLLVISCPCGLVISIPLSYFGGIGAAAKRGILVKGATFLDTLNSVNTVVFDKTGTLTEGVFKVSKIVPKNDFKEVDLLSLAAQAESHSNHPIAQSIREAYAQKIENEKIREFEEIAGYGIKAKVNNKMILAGNERLLHREKINIENGESLGTVVHLAVEGEYAGYLVIADEIKADAADGIYQLKKLGIKPIIMLTGDRKNAAQSVAEKLGLDRYFAELLPEDKVEVIETLIHQTGEQDKVAFVGDGINDAPVIARADVGIAMGRVGSDAAIETADIVMMTDAPSQVAEAIKIGRKTHKIVWQNIVLALGIKGLFILFGLFGMASLWEAIFADVGVALLAVFNASRVLKTSA